ncbi:MAG: hypothetical protein AAGH41_07235 [Pseudomonadota bacterium]
MTQDDLLLLHHLRAHACGGTCLEASKKSLSQDPGRAAGRVLSWSLGRVASHLAKFGRRSWRCGDGLVPTPQEARTLVMIRSLAQYNRQAAENAALWLVSRKEVTTLLERAAPLTAFYSASPSDRRAAQA